MNDRGPFIENCKKGFHIWIHNVYGYICVGCGKCIKDNSTSDIEEKIFKRDIL